MKSNEGQIILILFVTSASSSFSGKKTEKGSFKIIKASASREIVIENVKQLFSWITYDSWTGENPRFEIWWCQMIVSYANRTDRWVLFHFWSYKNFFWFFEKLNFLHFFKKKIPIFYLLNQSLNLPNHYLTVDFQYTVDIGWCSFSVPTCRMCQTCGSPLLNINFELITFLNLKQLQIFTIT